MDQKTVKKFTEITIGACLTLASTLAQADPLVPGYECLKGIMDADRIAGIASSSGGKLVVDGKNPEYASFVDSKSRKLYIADEKGIFSVRIPHANQKTPKYKWEVPETGWSYQFLMQVESPSLAKGKPLFLSVIGGGGHRPMKDASVIDQTGETRSTPVPKLDPKTGWDENGYDISWYERAYPKMQANEDLGDESKKLFLKQVTEKLADRRQHFESYGGLGKPPKNAKERDERLLKLKKSEAYLERLAACKSAGSSELTKIASEFEAILRARVKTIEAGLGMTDSSRQPAADSTGAH